ncbi:MAG: hypothetical protein AAF633_10045 [Chloroflexota bacterium]
MSRESDVKKYFTKTPKEPVPLPPDQSAIGCLFLGGMVSLGGLAVLLLFSFRSDIIRFAGVPFIVIGVLLLLMGLLYRRSIRQENELDFQEAQDAYEAAFAKAEPKPPDSQIDTWFEEDMDLLTHSAPIHLGVDAEAELGEPIVVKGLSEGVAARIGADKKIRFSENEIWKIYLMDHALSIYTGRYSLATGMEDLGDRQEIALSNFVSVSQEYKDEFDLTIDGEDKLVSRYTLLSLKFLNGYSISIPTLDGTLYVRENHEEFDVDLTARERDEDGDGEADSVVIHGERVPIAEIKDKILLPDSGAREAYNRLRELLLEHG